MCALAPVIALPGAKFDTPYRGTELRQTRQHYDPAELDLLIESIHEEGLISPVGIAQLTESEARRYIKIWNQIWGTRYRLKDLSRGPEGFYEPVIYGHRRRRAGIALCEQGQAPHEWLIKFHLGISAEEALELQFQENVHVRPSTWEDAESIYAYWAYLKAAGREIGPTELARRVGRSSSAVRGYIKFGQAPASIQQAVRLDQIPYGLGLILADATSKGVISVELLECHWLPIAVALRRRNNGRSSIKEFERSFKERVAQAASGQDDLFGALSVDSVQEALASDRRAIVLPELIRGVYSATYYLLMVIEMDRKGLFGEGTIFSLESPNRVTRGMVDALREVLPILRQHIPDDRHPEDLAMLDEVSGLLERLQPA